MSIESSHPTDAPPAPPIMHEHPFIQDFADICDQMKDTHRRKSHDYGYKDDPHANFDQSTNFGVDPFTGLMLRLNDKVVRIQNFIKKGRLMNESVEDALLDIAVYAVIGLVKIRRKKLEVPIGPR